MLQVSTNGEARRGGREGDGTINMKVGEKPLVTAFPEGADRSRRVQPRL